MSLLQGLIDENVDRHTRDLVTLTATASITSADHAGRTLLMGEVGGDAAATFRFLLQQEQVACLTLLCL